jgi:DNA-directed RNA polymerase subunit RPC12/RpoP
MNEMLELRQTRDWEEAFKLLYGGDSLRAYRSRSCVKCGQEYDALLHRGCCPYCGHRSILAPFLEKAAAEVEQLLKEAQGVR